MRGVLVLVAITACDSSGSCPARDEALTFRIGTTTVTHADPTFAAPHAIALGGTVEMRVDAAKVISGRPESVAFDREFTVTTSGDAVAPKSIKSPAFVVEGRHEGVSDLTVFDCDGTQLGDPREVRAVAVDHASLAWTAFSDTPVIDGPVAFMTGADIDASQGALELSVALWEGGIPAKRLVDASMTIAAALGSVTRWDGLRIESGAPGTYEVEVTAGELHTSLPLVLTDHVDVVAAINPPSVIHPMQEVLVCFSATYQGREIPNALWRWVVDGVPDPGRHPFGCRAIFTTSTSGTVVVTADAGGRSATVTLAVQP